VPIPPDATIKFALDNGQTRVGAKFIPTLREQLCRFCTLDRQRDDDILARLPADGVGMRNLSLVCRASITRRISAKLLALRPADHPHLCAKPVK
jgi:hypothetical protein